MDRMAFNEQIWELRLSMLRLAGSILCSPSDVEDAVSSAVVLAYQKLSTLRQEECVKSWLLTITVRCCYAQLKRNRRETPAREVTPPENSLQLPDWHGTLLDALRSLPPGMREALYLFYYEGMRTQEIARVLHLSRTGVSMRLKRGREMLREWLENEELGGKRR